MAFTTLLHQTMTIQRRTVSGYDTYGNETYTTANMGPYACRLQERTGTEDNDDRETVERRAIVFLDPTTPVQHDDYITVAGVQWQVIGQPLTLDDGTGPHHTEVTVVRYQP